MLATLLEFFFFSVNFHFHSTTYPKWNVYYSNTFPQRIFVTLLVQNKIVINVVA